ncbi:MAG: hypothetical protein V1899_03320 [Planctomycetota bacterium]
MKRRQVSLRYCSTCKATTRHTEAENTTTCTRCGTVKQVARITRQSSSDISEQQPD